MLFRSSTLEHHHPVPKTEHAHSLAGQSRPHAHAASISKQQAATAENGRRGLIPGMTQGPESSDHRDRSGTGQSGISPGTNTGKIYGGRGRGRGRGGGGRGRGRHVAGTTARGGMERVDGGMVVKT